MKIIKYVQENGCDCLVFRGDNKRKKNNAWYL